MKLTGQTALVTGSASGIGKAIALALASAGADVVVNYLDDRAAAEEVAHLISALGRRAVTIQADVSDESQVVELFHRTICEFGRLQIAVCNAGIQRDAALTEMSGSQWESVIQTNLSSQFYCFREAAREFRRSGVDEAISKAAGKILSISSVHEKLPWAGHVNYAASKAGVMMLMKSAALELAPFRIRVNAIAPGAIQTAINSSAWSNPVGLAELEKLIPWGRIGQSDEIGRAAVWLCSDESDYMTGSTIVIDGGLSLKLRESLI